ncbi:hypothetical protein SAMN05421724_0478 [Pseudomonas syringae]|nr:hypothetical protein SAMN05421724_0478 [Pseudomonas syringae]
MSPPNGHSIPARACLLNGVGPRIYQVACQRAYTRARAVRYVAHCLLGLRHMKKRMHVLNMAKGAPTAEDIFSAITAPATQPTTSEIKKNAMSLLL